MFKNLSLEALGLDVTQSEMIELTLSHGFRSVQLNLLELADQVRTHGLPKARRLFDSAKLRLGYFAVPVDLEAEDADFKVQVAALEPMVPWAAELGCTRAVLGVAPASEELPYHQNFERHRQRLTEVAKRLAASGIRLGLSFAWSATLRRGRAFEFVHDLNALCILLSTVGGANVGAVVDTWELRASGFSPDELRSRLRPEQIVAAFVADGPEAVAPAGWLPEARALPGESAASDVATWLQVLAEMGFDGPVTPTPHPGKFVGQRRDAVVKQAAEALDRVWKGAGLSASGKLAIAPSAGAC